MIQTVPVQPTLAIRLRCAPPEMSTRVPDAIGRVHDRLSAAGATSVGPPYTRYLAHDIAGGLFEIEVGVPVAHRVPGCGDLVASDLPGGSVAELWHAGTYATLGQSFAKLAQLVSDQGLTPAGPPWEQYVIGPRTESDPSKWRTVLRQPLAGAAAGL